MKHSAHPGSHLLLQTLYLGDARALAMRSLACALALFAAACGETHTPTTPSWGAACGPDTPCEGSTCLDAFPGGYCTLDCTSMECGEGAICDRSFSPDLCLDACASGSECRSGYQCFRGGCRPMCSGDAECGDAARCESGMCVGVECTTDEMCGAGRRCDAGACVDIVDGGPVLIANGSPCTADEQCSSGICLAADRGGVCSIECADPRGCNSLPGDFECGPATRDGTLGTYCIPWGSGGALAVPCTSDAQCRSLTCGPDGQCTRACTAAANCLTGQICTPLAWGGGTFMGCGYTPTTGVEVREIDLGPVTMPAGTGTRELSFAVPPTAVSVTLQAVETGGDRLPLTFITVTDSAGTAIFDIETLADFTDPPIRWLPLDSEEAIAMLVPNTTTDRYALRHGAMRFAVAAYPRMEGDTGSVATRLSALVKVAPGGVISAGTIDVHVHLVGVGVTAAAAPTNTRVQAFVTRFDEVVSAIGLDVGNVDYTEITGADATTYQVIDSTDGPDSELARLFRLSAGRTTPGLNLFLVRSVESGGDGFNTLGIAGGIPGMPRTHGTMHSGVVVAFDASVVGTGTGGGRVAGHVASHETGHFLGLFHTTERSRPCAAGEDPSTSMCAPFGGTDTVGDTVRGDTDNLMNWSIVGGGVNDELSAGQGFVLLRSAIVR